MTHIRFLRSKKVSMRGGQTKNIKRCFTLKEGIIFKSFLLRIVNLMSFDMFVNIRLEFT